jgi:hypothetical protein
MIATTGRMHDHWAKCKKRPRAIGQLDAGFQPSRKSAKTWTVQSSSTHSSTGNGGNMVGELVEPLNPLPFFTSDRQHFDSLKKDKLEKLHQLFTHGVHHTAMPYSAFEHSAWKDFFQVLHGYFQLPSSTAISGEPHAIHNLCMDLIKNFPGVKHVLKQIVFMVKTLKSSHFLLQLFDKLCLEKFKKTYVFILFTKTRRGTVFFTAQHVSMVKATCATLPGEIMHAELDIDICDELKALVTDPAYWKGVIAMEMLFMTISSCLTYLEGDKTTFSAVYACFVAIKYHIKMLNRAVMDAFNLGDNDIK